MRNTFVALAAFLLTAANATAQPLPDPPPWWFGLKPASESVDYLLWPDPPWCPTCYVAANIDIPVTGGPPPGGWSGLPVPYGAWYIAGWAYNCHSGALPERVEVSYRDDAGHIVLVRDTYLIQHLPRPDVEAAMAPRCPGTPSDAGFAIFIAGTPIPRGPRELFIHLWHGDTYNLQGRTVTIY